MTSYDFSQLSSHEFEALAADILSKEFGYTFELFTPGPDGGIDLRHLSANDGIEIVQCKHYVHSSFSDLRRDLKKEREKIELLSPQRYRVVTSKSLTPGNKSDIAADLAPFLKGPEWILGQDDLNHLLRKHPSVLKAHFKLWITSTAALQEVLQEGVKGRTPPLYKQLIETARIYVMNPSFDRAQDLLSRYHVCIVSGEPGIGKTTLAEMLLLQHAEQGFEIVVISADVAEAESTYDTTSNQIFYYDDFLGQVAAAEKLGKNEQYRLVKLIERISESASKRLVMTTREYLLQNAKQDYESLNTKSFTVHEMVLDLAQYSRVHRAHIFYNHLDHANLDLASIESLLADETYLRVIDHPNYSPRLIDFVTDEAAIEQRGAHFVDFVLGSLENPSHVWQHAYDRHLRPHERLVLQIITTFAGVSTDVSAFGTFQQIVEDTLEPDKAFKDSLKVLEGSFLTITKSSGETVLHLKNPSVQDFLLNCAITSTFLSRILDAAVAFEQLQFLLAIAEEGDEGYWTASSDVRLHASSNPDEWVRALARTFEDGTALRNRTWSNSGLGIRHKYVRHHGSLGRLTFMASQTLVAMPDDWWARQLLGAVELVLEKGWHHQYALTAMWKAVILDAQLPKHLTSDSERLSLDFLVSGPSNLDEFGTALEFLNVSRVSTDHDVERLTEAFKVALDYELDILSDEDDDRLGNTLGWLVGFMNEFGVEPDSRFQEAEDWYRALDERDDPDSFVSEESEAAPPLEDDASSGEIVALFESLRSSSN